MKSYYTIKQSGSHEVIIQKSRFIGHVKRVQTEDEAQAFIQAIKKKHYDATHNCSAYIVGDNDQYQKANDDGEPSGTAGIPMLEVLKRMQLKNTAVVVTRYFGGIKDRKSTRLNSSHVKISYAVFCLKKKKTP